MLRGSEIADDLHTSMFEREIASLARLQHPGIASLFDSGRTESGLRYFAMELVDGEPIVEFADRSGLSLRERVALVRDVCEAITYAHQRGIIHRDLKPANVLVARGAGGPLVKVLDFGLARMIDGETGATTLHSSVRRIQGTLCYMSPEQAAGNPDEVDVRTDVYSLGVLLYELITGSPPLRLDGLSLPDAIAVVLDQVPKRPSRLRREARGDLDVISLCALEKSSARRYASVSELEADLRRFQQRRPVLARNPGASYRLAKLVHRHRIASAFALVIVCGSLVIATWMSLLYRQTRIAERSAEAEARAVRELNHCVLGMLTAVDADLAPERDTRIDNMIAALTESLDSAQDLPAGLEAETRQRIANFHLAEQRYDEAIAQLRQAEELHAQHTGPQGVARALALSDLGACYHEMLEFDEAERRLSEALAMLEAHGLSSPDDRVVVGAATCHWLLAQIRMRRGHSTDAEDQLRRGLAMPLQSREDAGPVAVGMAAQLGWILMRSDRHAEAEPVLRDAVAQAERVMGVDDVRTAAVVKGLATLRIHQLRGDEAEELLERCLEIYRKRCRPEDPRIADVHSALARVAMDRQDYQESLRLLHLVLEVYQANYGGNDVMTASTLVDRGTCRLRLEDVTGGVADLRRALRIQRQALGREHPQIIQTLITLADALVGLDEYDDAESLLHEAVRIQDLVVAEGHADRVPPLVGLAHLYAKDDRLEESERYLRQALALHTASDTEARITRANLHAGLTNCLTRQGRFDEAGVSERECLAELDRTVGPSHPLAVRSAQRLAEIYQQGGEEERSREILQSIQKRVRGEAEAQSESGPP